MKGRLGRVAVFATAIALTVTGTMTGSSSAATVQASPQDGAVVVQSMYDALKGAADAGSVEKTKSTLDELSPLLAELRHGERYATRQSSRDLAGAAGEENTTTRAQVEELFPAGAQKADLPSVAELLNVLVQRLLVSLSSLVNDLLGGVPFPIRAATN
jgi:hypothetical protein